MRSTTHMVLEAKIKGSELDMVMAWRKDCSMDPPRTRARISGATGMSIFLKPYPKAPKNSKT